MNLLEETFENIVEKRRCWYAVFSAFPRMFSILSRMKRYAYEKIENIEGKGEISGVWYFLLFWQCSATILKNVFGVIFQ